MTSVYHAACLRASLVRSVAIPALDLAGATSALATALLLALAVLHRGGG